MIYTFQVSGFVEVEADDEQAATLKLQNPSGVPRTFTVAERENKVFVYVVAVGQPREGR
jgi:hypothetical protein